MSITGRWKEDKCRSNVPKIKEYSNCAIAEHGTWLYQLSCHACALAIIMGSLNELWELLSAYRGSWFQTYAEINIAK